MYNLFVSEWEDQWKGDPCVLDASRCVRHHEYTDEQIAGAQAAVAGKTEMEAMIAYLQQLGLALKGRR